MDFVFIFNSFLLGVGLAMDAFSVSLADGLNNTKMKKGKMCGTAFVYAFFQAVMPLTGWVCVHKAAEKFQLFEKAVPFIALGLLGFIGGEMLYDGIRKKTENEKSRSGFAGLLIQGVATSIDALSVGFTISEYDLTHALSCALIIAAVTFAICFSGIAIGKKFGTKLSDKAAILGGSILIIIGIEIFVSGMLK